MAELLAPPVVSALDQILVDIDAKLTEQVRLITAHEDFERLKSLWFGLYALCDHCEPMPDVIIDMLAVTKEDLLYDFDEYLDLADSALFYHLYKSEYDQAGGVPYATMLLQFNFRHTPADILLLRQVSMVAAGCHCPVIANADPRLFGRKNFAGLEQIRDYELLFEAQEYIKWNQFRDREDSRYLGLALPEVRLDCTDPQRRPPRWTRTLTDAENTWTHATYAFGMALASSFHKHGWCVYIRGPHTGGLIDAVIGPDWGDRGYNFRELPVALGFSDRQEQELARKGFIPLTYHRERERLCIFSAPTLQGGGSQRDDKLAASLPYLYLVSRIAHYHKSIQRENLGKVADSDELQRELEQWLKTLITRMPDPSLEMRSRFPLRNGGVVVEEDPGSPGFFTVQMLVQPHLQLEGVNAQLTLVSKMPRKE